MLMTAGDRDFVTPMAWAGRLIGAFPRVRLIVIPQMGHVRDGLADLECFDALIGEFLANPDPEALDAERIAGMKPPAFALLEIRGNDD